MRILLIEDDHREALWTYPFLQRVYGGQTEIHHAKTLGEGLAALDADAFDVTLIDLAVPADELVALVRRITQAYVRMPCIVMTGESNDELATKLFTAGAVEYLVKASITLDWMKRAISYAIHRKRATEDLRDAAAEFLTMISVAEDAIITVDAGHHIRVFNPAAERMFGYVASEILGERLDVLLPERFRGAHGGHMEAFARGPIVSRRMTARPEVTGLRRDGTEFPAEVAISRLALWGRPILMAVIRDMTEQKRFEDELRKLSTTDPVTGVANRRKLLEAGQRELERSVRYGSPLSVLLFDIDHFKQVNDAYGHAAGDTTLCGAAAACGEILRRNDLLARIGGDEFAVLLPETELDSAVRLAERVCARVAECQWFHGGSAPVSVTVSVGCAAAAGDERIEALLEHADFALLQAKRAGRNRVVAFREPPAAQ